jgi:hypothetical protein
VGITFRVIAFRLRLIPVGPAGGREFMLSEAKSRLSPGPSAGTAAIAVKFMRSPNLYANLSIRTLIGRPDTFSTLT